ncbi:MAG TPA: murein biosynthesis integral membrane protein MurJ [Vicinamibacteria bacterium]
MSAPVKVDPLEPAPRPRSSFRSAGLISALTLLSRVFGLAREQVFAALLGAGPQAEAFQVAFRIPNLLRDLFAEGALSAAFVPTYARAMAEGKDRAHQLASRLLTVLAVVLGALVLVGVILARPLVSLMAPGFEREPGKTDLTVLLTRVMLPFLPIVSFAAVAMGVLNAQQKFGTPAAAPAVFNVVAIACGALLYVLGWSPAAVAVGWAVGTVLGGIAQFAIQLPPLVRSGWRFRPDFAPNDPAIRTIARLMTPATVGLGAVQVNIFVSTMFASHEPGAVAWLQYAFRILYLPIGVFGVALGTIATTGFALRAAADDMEGVRHTLRQSLRMLGFLTVPATAGLMVLAVPIVRLLFERGHFKPTDTHATAVALVLYALGLVSYTGVKVLAPAFYALGAPRVPVIASASAVATNLMLILALHGVIGYRAIALGTSLGSLAQAGILAVALQSRVGGLRGHELGSAFAKMVAAAAVMGGVAWAAWALIERQAGTRGLTAQLVTCLAPIGLGVAVYLAAAWALGLPELSSLADSMRRRRPPQTDRT